MPAEPVFLNSEKRLTFPESIQRLKNKLRKMARIEIVMPKMGESIVEATVLKWLKNVGDSVAVDEPIMEIATDKVDSEVPSQVEGKLTDRRFREGDVVPVGEVIAIIETAGGTKELSQPKKEEVKSPLSQNGNDKPATVEKPVFRPQEKRAEIAASHIRPVSNTSGNRFYSPLVLNIARQESVSISELESLDGSGLNGRVTKKDILSYVKGPRSKPAIEVRKSESVAMEGKSSASAAKVFSHTGNMEIVEMDRMRKMIAENMVYSKDVSAHVTSFVEADVTAIVNWRNRVKGEFEKRYGQKLTFTPVFAEAVAKALREMPMVNVSVDGDRILVKKDINIGIAVALRNDNLIVPVIRNADQLNLIGLSSRVNDLAARARDGKLKLEELEGGTYTISNVGTFGNVMGTPIIMQPQCAILATGAIRKKPAVVESPDGDMIAIRHMMFLSHSYDHRVIDGALGGRFVRRVADILEEWNPDREI